MTRRQAFRQTDVLRAVRGVKAAGVAVSRVEIDQAGKIVIVSGQAESTDDVDHLAAWKAGRHAREAKRHYGTRADKVWSDGDLEAFMAVARPEMRLALMLALWTGQRQGDLLRLPWSAYDGRYIRLKQSKTGVRVTIPAGAPLKAMLDALPRRSPVVMLSSFKRPWTEDSFRVAWGRTAAQANIDDRTFHDLRGTAVLHLALAGCTEAEIATITGHSLRDVRSILDRHYFYRDTRLADSGIDKLDAMVAALTTPANAPAIGAARVPRQHNGFTGARLAKERAKQAL